MNQVADIQARVPPCDIPAEAAILGAMMVYSDCVTKVREILTEDQFYRPAHQIIYRAICWMADHPARFGVPDLVTLRAALAERGKLESIGGVDYLVELAKGTPGATNVEYYARIVQDKARRRGLIIAGTMAAQAAHEHGDTDEIINNATATIAKATKAPSRRHTKSAAAEVAESIEQAIAGKRESISWPWVSVTRWARPCAPGAVTIFCGDPGSGKSFALQQAMLQWHNQSVKIAMLHLEKDRRYHQTRALGQLCGDHSILSTGWQKHNPDKARQIMADHTDVITSFGATVWDDPDGAMSLEAVQAWISARAAEQARIIGVDPITAAESGPKPWEADRRLIVTCQSIAARTGCSIILVSHPRNANNTVPSIDSLAGGRAYGRLTDCVLWLQRHDPPAENRVQTPCGPTDYQHNRSLSLLKTRDGIGQGLTVAMQFAGESLSMCELGTVIVKKRKQKRKDDEDE